MNAGRRHYAAVEKSKLRKGDVASLGPQYSGSRVSRQAVNGDGDEEEHDPFAEYDSDGSREDGLDEDDDDKEEEEEGGGDVEDFDDNEEEGTEDTSVDDDEDGSDLSDDEDNDEDDENEEAEHQIDREQLKKMLHSDHTNVAATIAQANRADADKGRAVKTQRKTFNGILNSRIRLQQGLIAINSLTAEEVTESSTDTDTTSAIHTAELAALKLWNTLESLRQRIEDARSSDTKKRKRDIDDDNDIDSTTTTSTIWARMQSAEKASLPHRRAILQKWSTKTQAATAQPTRGKLTTNTSSAPSTILDVLTSHLSNPEPLIARTRIPRSCAPLQASASQNTPPTTTSVSPTNTTHIYDDADFYGLLLKSLLEQHSIDSGTNVSISSSTIARQHMAAARDAKTKKNVDVKASKGRKLKYTVHEELQNYMAPEDRGRWTGRQVDEFFGSLLGRRVEIGEEGGEDGGEGEEGEEEALMLFRS